MEESDNMLITTLKEFINLPEHIASLKDIRAEEIFTVSLNLLEHLKVDVSEVKSLSGKAQRFRSMAKLNQNLYQELQTQFELNELMNPSIPFLRKFLLTIINKLGSQSLDKGKKDTRNQTVQKSRQEKRQLKIWLNEEWIHPSLVSKRPKYKGYILPMTINKNLLKNNINLTAELNNPLLLQNTQSIINLTVAKHTQRVRQFEANQGISRKQHQEEAIRLKNIAKVNKDDWIISSSKLQKLKKKMNEANDSSIIAAPQPSSVFKQQLQQAQFQIEKKKEVQEVKPNQQSLKELTQEISMNPMQVLKRQAQNKRQKYEQDIRDILHDLKERKQAIENWQKQKQALEAKLITDDEKIVKIKQETVDLKKQVQKRQTILQTLQGQKDVEEEVKKLEGEILMIEDQVKQEVEKISNQTNSLQVESKEKMEALSDLKIKLNKIEGQYERICEEITEKQEIKGSVKIMKSGISRLYYHKKISQMESRWRDTQKETKKLRESVKQLRQKTRVSGTLNLRVETQIENILNMDKNKSETENKQLRQLMSKCRQTFGKTLKTLEEVNEVKMQTQQYEMKVHTLSGKNYKQNIEKINLAMEDLRKEILELSKAKTK